MRRRARLRLRVRRSCDLPFIAMAKSSNLAGLEASAISLMSRAVELDAASRFQESLTCYQEGIQLLMNVIKETTDGAKKNRYRQKISDYMDRAEQIKQQVCKEKEAGKYHEQIKIPDNGIGYSYSKLFQPYLDNTLKEVWVNDPYIRQIHQITNLQRFCEMLLKGPAKVKIINLLTTQDDVRHTNEQTNSLEELRKSLHNYGVILNIEYSNTLHDREIRFNNGWIIKIGRGLDYFKKHQGRFSIGYWDYDLRQCHETTVDIFHRQHTKEA